MLDKSYSPKRGRNHARRLLQRSRWRKRPPEPSRHRSAGGAALATHSAAGRGVCDAKRASKEADADAAFWLIAVRRGGGAQPKSLPACSGKRGTRHPQHGRVRGVRRNGSHQEGGRGRRDLVDRRGGAGRATKVLASLQPAGRHSPPTVPTGVGSATLRQPPGRQTRTPRFW